MSATGTGELFIRAAFGHAIASALARGGLSLDEAAGQALADVSSLGGWGGCVALDAAGAVAMPFTAPVMYRGVIDGENPPCVGIFPGALVPLRPKQLDRNTPPGV